MWFLVSFLLYTASTRCSGNSTLPPVTPSSINTTFGPPPPVVWPENDDWKEKSKEANKKLLLLLRKRTKTINDLLDDYKQKVLSYSLAVIIVPIFDTILLIILICSFINGMRRRQRISIPQMVHEIHEALLVKDLKKKDPKEAGEKPGEKIEAMTPDQSRNKNNVKEDMQTLRGLIETTYNTTSSKVPESMQPSIQKANNPQQKIFVPNREEPQSTDLNQSISTLLRDRPHRNIKAELDMESAIDSTQRSTNSKKGDEMKLLEENPTIESEPDIKPVDKSELKTMVVK